MKGKKRRTFHSAAVVTIRNAAKMSPSGRKRVAAWLRMHADDLETYGAQYAGGFQGRYLYPGK